MREQGARRGRPRARRPDPAGGREEEKDGATARAEDEPGRDAARTRNKKQLERR